MDSERSYYRIMLGAQNECARQCYVGKWFGGGYEIPYDLSKDLDLNLGEFKAKYIPLYLKDHPRKPKATASLICGMIYALAKGIRKNDIVLCPTGEGTYWTGIVVSDYIYVAGSTMPHRREVEWYPKVIERTCISDAMRNSLSFRGTLNNITKHAAEIEMILFGNDASVEAPEKALENLFSFALESHLEDFLVENWDATALGQNYDIYEDEGIIGQQVQTTTGRIDILALRKDKKEFLVIELKKGRASDVVVGQIQRYMGDILEEYAAPDQTVRGCIIALEDDLRIRRALRTTLNIDFYRYQIDFKLSRAT